MSPDSIPPTPRGKERRDQLLRAAEMLFGEKGYAETSVSDIARAAGAAQGTFYLYFQSKTDIFCVLVAEIGRTTRRALTAAVQGRANRLDAERIGIAAFLNILAERPALFRIIEEARFVAPQAYRQFHEDFAANYADQLQQAQQAGEIAAGDAHVQAWALMGLIKVLGERYVLWDQSADREQIANSAFALIRDGLKRV